MVHLIGFAVLGVGVATKSVSVVVFQCKPKAFGQPDSDAVPIRKGSVSLKFSGMESNKSGELVLHFLNHICPRWRRALLSCLICWAS